jgi:hypothetical protein
MVFVGLNDGQKNNLHYQLYELVQKEREKRLRCQNCQYLIIDRFESRCKLDISNKKFNCRFRNGENPMSEFKETQYGEGKKYDNGKLRYDLLDPCLEEAVVEILGYGAKKYEANNWQNVEPFNDRYYAALRRHLAEWRKGNKIDPESGKRHLAHVACNIYFLLWKELQDDKTQTS